MSCVDCTKNSPLTKPAAGCTPNKEKLGFFRFGCCDKLIETFNNTTSPDCVNGYINSVVYEDILDPTPLFAVDITNKEDVDELDDFTFDRATDLGEDTYSITLNIKVYSAENQCTFESLKGQDVCIFYKIIGRTGNEVWRRFRGKLTAVTGGLLGSYACTFDILNPDDSEKPKFVNFGTAAATTAALDALTNF